MYSIYLYFQYDNGKINISMRKPKKYQNKWHTSVIEDCTEHIEFLSKTTCITGNFFKELNNLYKLRN